MKIVEKIQLLVYTVIHLKPVQLYYRFFYIFRNMLMKTTKQKLLPTTIEQIIWVDSLIPDKSCCGKNEFKFLNKSKSFGEKIDWNFSDYGKLWTYNLNYFDFLLQKDMSKEQGNKLIEDYIEQAADLSEGKEPYPISLRGINWIKFLSNYKINDEQINLTLNNHYHLLLKNLEYHLLGNHLLENGFSLLFAGYYFRDDKFYNVATKILRSQLDEQILGDGGHFELSPMYHKIILHRLLDVIRLIKLNVWKSDTLLEFLIQKAGLMLGWLQNITYRSGDTPMVNDSAYGIVASSKEIFEYASELDIPIQANKLSDSGYRKITTFNYELFIDVGNIGPSYQPGHAHSDTFSFELQVDETPVIVDTGTSTYDKSDLRNYERSTVSHNTVQVAEQEQTQVWGGFRVAKRAKIIEKLETKNSIKATHDGFNKIGVLHERTFEWLPNKIFITDRLSNQTNQKSKAYYHLHSALKKPDVVQNKVFIEELNVLFDFENHSSIEIVQYQLAAGFNIRTKSYKIIVTFDDVLLTTISV